MSEPNTPAAAEPAVSQDALGTMSSEARAKWELDGVWPAPGESTTTADPDADEHDEPEPVPAGDPPPAAPVPETAAAPVATTPAKPVSKRQAHINELQRKAAESEQRASELAAKIAELESRTKPADEPKAEPAKPPTDRFTFPGYDDAYIAANPGKSYDDWEIERLVAFRDWDRAQQQAATAKADADKRDADDAKEFNTKRAAWDARRDDFTAKHPDRASTVLAFLKRVTPGTPIGDTILESEVGAELADYLAANLPEAERIARLAPISALRELGKLEARLSPTHASASAQPAAKTVTTAPAPPTTLAARSADPADPVAAAVARGDYSAFEAHENPRAAVTR